MAASVLSWVVSTPNDEEQQHQFMSWVSVSLLMLMVVFFRSSASAFLVNPMAGEKTSTYTQVTILLYCWVLSATTLTLVPHFSTHYNEIIAAALFFPMMLATVAAILIGRLLIRMVYYATMGCSRRNNLKGKRRPRQDRLSSIHRPFSKLLKSSAFCSAGICMLHAHCWSRDLQAFKVDRQHDGAGAVCRAVFSQSTFGGMLPQEGSGASGYSIWFIWAFVVVVRLSFFVMDEFSGGHTKTTITTFERQSRTSATNGHVYQFESYEQADDTTSETSSFSGDDSGSEETDAVADHDVERPTGKLPMVSWYSILLFHTVFDILIELKVFLGRFDARNLMQPAVLKQASGVNEEARPSSTNGSAAKVTKDGGFDPSNYPSGTVFDCRPTNENDDELWFDFMADCGDGFDSSYNVARMLAQKELSVKVNGASTSRVDLPRGKFLVVGGDLAYPHPTEANYEKRFFRTFEDAMPPPPSYRREQISTKKPDLPVSGWRECFSSNVDDDTPREELLKLYKGPSAFLIPGNHDWYDGLATYSRYILSRNWVGGWLMPQKRSYFALRLTHGWWVLGFDLGLSQDIDVTQFKFFANVATSEMGPTDSCIVVTHEPSWVLNADAKLSESDDLPEKNLRELMKHHLGGRIRARLAGDLHHYTRHVPIRNKSGQCVQTNSLPQLIVSGGGGAFLHPTHTFEDFIQVGEEQNPYHRVRAYPEPKISYRLSWLNIWQFRWRNWAFDMFGATVYFGIASSAFPLCGIYADYLEHNGTHSLLGPFFWVVKTIWALMVEIFSSGNLSLIFTLALLLTLQLLTDYKIKPATRFVWSLLHTFMHVASALACLVFVECIAEWTIHEGIVKVTTTTKRKQQTGIDLASSLYAEYMAHFPVFSSNLHSSPPESEVTHCWPWLYAQAYERMAMVLNSWVVPLLQATLEVFDLPGTIAQKHTDMCRVLCQDGMDCLLRSDSARFLGIDRTTVASYLFSVSLYFFILAIPFAGNVFGTWLALTLNVFKAQPNEGFSSLRISHWKNFLRLHVNKTGDLEVFAVGLPRSPKRWIKDTLWNGNLETNDETNNNRSSSSGMINPSWKWERPSRWIPEKPQKGFDPELVDFARISKTKSER